MLICCFKLIVSMCFFDYFRDCACEQRELLNTRQYLDHRQVEEGFLLYAAVQVMKRYIIKFKNGKCTGHLERNLLMEMVVSAYEKGFYEKWTGVHNSSKGICKNSL